jgi:hypothetical protein
MRALLIVLAVACAIGLAVAWYLADARGADMADAFAQAFYLSLIGVALTAVYWRRGQPPAVGLGLMVFYLALWGGAIALVMLIYQWLNPGLA